MNRVNKTDEGVRSSELRELALYFFKQGDYTAKEAYDHAHSFLSISKNKYGEDIVDVFVKCESVTDYSPELLSKTYKYYLAYEDAVTGFKFVVLTILGKYLSTERIEWEVNNYIMKNMIPKSLSEDANKVCRVKLVYDPDVKSRCQGVLVKRGNITCR